MLILSMIFVILHFTLTGMLSGAILTNRAEGKPSHWNLYVFSIICFFSGLYFLIACIGHGVNICSGS